MKKYLKCILIQYAHNSEPFISKIKAGMSACFCC